MWACASCPPNHGPKPRKVDEFTFKNLEEVIIYKSQLEATSESSGSTGGLIQVYFFRKK
jgi:hypothetical protein